MFGIFLLFLQIHPVFQCKNNKNQSHSQKPYLVPECCYTATSEQSVHHDTFQCLLFCLDQTMCFLHYSIIEQLIGSGLMLSVVRCWKMLRVVMLPSVGRCWKMLKDIG